MRIELTVQIYLRFFPSQIMKNTRTKKDMKFVADSLMFLFILFFK